MTPAGRGVGVVLMVLGITLFGYLAGALASFFFERDEEARVDPQLQELNERLARMEELLTNRVSERGSDRPRS